MHKAIKILLGVLVGLIVWTVVATIGNFAIRALISGYAEAEPAMRFTLPMLLARLALAPSAHWPRALPVPRSCARSRIAAKFLAGLLVIFFIPIHFVVDAISSLVTTWSFLVSLAPLVLLGARLAGPIASGKKGAA
jgi:hypothetical protein